MATLSYARTRHEGPRDFAWRWHISLKRCINELCAALWIAVPVDADEQ